jgi:hypothetical protein
VFDIFDLVSVLWSYFLQAKYLIFFVVFLRQQNFLMVLLLIFLDVFKLMKGNFQGTRVMMLLLYTALLVASSNKRDNP